MKTIITTLVLLISLSSFSQIEQLGKWKIGASASYDMDLYTGFNNIDIVDPGFAPGGCYGNDYYGTRGYSAGIVGQYSIRPRLEVGIGATYSKKHNQYGSSNYFTYDPLLCYEYYYAPSASNFLDVPVFLRYNFLKSKLNFHIESGVTSTYTLDKFDYYNTSKFAFKAQGGLGVSYTIGQLINISATTFYKRKLTDFNRSTDYGPKNSMSFELRTVFIL